MDIPFFMNYKLRAFLERESTRCLSSFVTFIATTNSIPGPLEQYSDDEMEVLTDIADILADRLIALEERENPSTDFYEGFI